MIQRIKITIVRFDSLLSHLQRIDWIKYIYNVFGAIAVRLLKEWIKHRQSIYKSKLRIRFIKYCILNEIVPPHLFGLQRFNIHLHDHTSKTKLDDLKNCFTKRLLKIELKDAYESMNHSCNQLFHLVRNITKNLPWKTAQKFFENQEKRLFSLFLKERQRIDGKLKWLTNRQNNDEKQEHSTNKILLVHAKQHITSPRTHYYLSR